MTPDGVVEENERIAEQIASEYHSLLFAGVSQTTKDLTDRIVRALGKKDSDIKRLNKIIGGLDVENPSAVDVMIDAMKAQKEYISDLQKKLAMCEESMQKCANPEEHWTTLAKLKEKP